MTTDYDMVEVSVELVARQMMDATRGENQTTAVSAASAHDSVSSEFLKQLVDQLDVPLQNISFSRLRLEPVTNWTNGKSETIGYEARSTVEIKVSASSKLEAEIIGEAATLEQSQNGVEVTVSGFRPYVSDERYAYLEQELFEKAMSDATRKALMYAEGAQRDLGQVHKMSDSPMEESGGDDLPPIVPMQRAMYADAELGGSPSPSFPLGDKKLTKRIYLEYVLL